MILEKRGGAFVENAFAKASLEGGLIEIAGLAPGDYELFLRGPAEKVEVRVTAAGASDSGYALSRSRHVELKNSRPLQIASSDPGDETIRISLTNADPFTRTAQPQVMEGYE